MRVGILGSGDVGKALGRGFAARGYEVKIGSRHPTSELLRKWKVEAGPKASTGTFAEAAEHGEMIVLSVMGAAALPAIDLAGIPNFAGKLVIDTTNPLDFSKGMPPGLFVCGTDSLAERIQRKLAAAKVVKCFNIVPNSLMVDPKIPGGPPDMIICGNDADAKRQTTEILKSFGYPTAIDIGKIDGARWLETLTPLWVRVSQTFNTWNVGFKVLHGA